jgi:hypothetical protein
MFAGQLTSYTTRHTEISYCLTYQFLQVNLHPTPPDTPTLATVSHINVCRSAYVLHYQTHQGQLMRHISTFTGQLTSYTTRHTEISYCLAYQRLQVSLHPTPPDTPRSATASHISIRRSTHKLHHQTHRDQLLPHILMSAGQLTDYITRNTKVSYCLTYQYSEVNLQATPPDTLRLATASHISIRRSTYNLHHQTHQDQLLPRISVFAGQLTDYITRNTKVSYCLAYQYSQVNLPTTLPETPRSATASHISIRRSTYMLHHQTRQGQLLPRISTFTGQLTSYTTRHTEISYCLAYQRSQVNLHPTPPDTPRSATLSHISIRRSTCILHHQTHQH